MLIVKRFFFFNLFWETISNLSIFVCALFLFDVYCVIHTAVILKVVRMAQFVAEFWPIRRHILKDGEFHLKTIKKIMNSYFTVAYFT